MWAIRDSDGVETLHSIYPGWAKDLDHLTVIPYVAQARFDAVVAELEEAKKLLLDAQKIQLRHMLTMKQNSLRMREVESLNNRYYSLLQAYNLIGALPASIDDTPLIDVKV